MNPMNLAPNFALNPYLALGLHSNPFALGQQAMSQSSWINRGWSEAPAPAAGQLVQVLGGRGFGKTAHLSHWHTQTGGPYAYYPPGWARFKVPPVQKIAYWDEADRIPRPLLLEAFGRAARTQATLVAGTHTDLSRSAKLCGLAVKTICLPPLEAATLRVWADRQIQAVRVPTVPCYLTLPADTAQKIAAIAQGSWRTAADELHIWAAARANQAAAATQSPNCFIPAPRTPVLLECEVDDSIHSKTHRNCAR